MEKYEFKNIMVMGAGAVGGFFGGLIERSTDKKVVFIARGAHLEAMLLHGLRIKSEAGNKRIRVKASDDPSVMDEVDLVLLTVKSYDTDQAIRQLRPVIGPDTQILTIQNGIENYEKLCRAFGQERVVQGFCRIGASISEPGTIKHSAMGNITIGNPAGDDESRLQALRQLFETAGIPCTISDDITREVWLKFAWNSIFNMVTTVAAVTVDQLFDHHESLKLCYDLFEEIQQVAAARDVHLSDEDGEKLIEEARSLSGFTTSTFHDRKQGKRLEYEAFTGAILRVANSEGLKVPANRTLYALLKLIDEH